MLARAFVLMRETTSVNARSDGRFALSGRQMCASVMFAGACRAARVDPVNKHERNLSHGKIYAVRSRPGQPNVTHTMNSAPRATLGGPRYGGTTPVAVTKNQ